MFRIGYKASIIYLFELKQPADQNRILEELANFKEKYGEKMNFTVSHPEWIVSKKSLHKTEEDLKIELIDNAKSFAQKVSEKLGKTCSITSIDYDVRRPVWVWREDFYMLKSGIEKSIAEAPEQKRKRKQ